MNKTEENFRRHFKSQYHNNEIDALWEQCSKIFNTAPKVENNFTKILGARILHDNGRVRFCMNKILEEFGDNFTPKNIEYWISYDSKAKKILLQFRNSR